MGLLMDLFGEQTKKLDKYRTELVYEATYMATYKDGSKKRDKVQINCGLNGYISFKEVCRQIKYTDENIVKMKILNLKVKRISTAGNLIYKESELW